MITPALVHIDRAAYFWSFAMAWGLLSFTPGPGVLSTISHAIGYGRTRALINVFGQEVGLLAHFLMVAFGVAALVIKSAWAFSLMKWFGVGYLLYLGFRVWTAKPGSLEVGPAAGVLTSVELFKRGFFINFTNPKSSAWSPICRICRGHYF